KLFRSGRTVSRRYFAGGCESGRLEMPQFEVMNCPAAPSRLAVRFILVSAGVYAAALGLATGLVWSVPSPIAAGRGVFPGAFWLTTLLLALGSGLLQHASHCVRIERQRPFRRCLLMAVGAGMLFVGLQIYGLTCLIRNQVAEDVQTGANAFIVIIGALHAM